MKKKRNLSEYIIPIYGLSNKEHEYKFDINDAFFDSFEESIVKKGNFKVAVLLDRSETMIVANVTVIGVAKLMCDRSLDEFDFPIETSERILYKYEDKFEEIDDALFHIPFGEENLDVSLIIYDLINVQIPMKKLHPRFQEEESLEEINEFDFEEEEATLVYSSSEDEGEIENEEDEEQKTDPRWNKLKDLNNKLNSDGAS